jgi:hypothetical protein
MVENDDKVTQMLYREGKLTHLHTLTHHLQSTFEGSRELAVWRSN